MNSYHKETPIVDDLIKEIRYDIHEDTFEAYLKMRKTAESLECALRWMAKQIDECPQYWIDRAMEEANK